MSLLFGKFGIGNSHASEAIRTFIPAITTGVIGSQTVLASFNLSIPQLRRSGSGHLSNADV